MNRNYIIFLLFYVINFGLYAQDSIPDLFAGWSDERFQAYEDSLISVLFPKAEIRYYDVDYSLNDYSQEEVPQTYSLLPTVSVDKSKEVGEIGIKSGTTPTGARTYEIPIELYPGINGLTPLLSLVYNSQQGTSMVGQGWSLSGLSTIMRVPKTIYHDGKVDAVKMDFDDSFVLNGVRLVKKSQGIKHIIYETEQGNIKAIGYQNDSIFTHFEVFYPNGRKGVFGTPERPRRHPCYPITSLTDKNGNSIVFNYKLSYNYYYISSIIYNNDCSIEFKYDNERADPRIFRNGGVTIRLKRLLKGITCKIGSTVLGEYNLTYDTRYGKSLLTDVSYSAGGKSFNPLKFYYGDGIKPVEYDINNTKIQKSYHPTAENSVRIVKGRFDAESGNEGVLTFRNYTPYWRHYRNSTVFRHSQHRFINLYEADEEIFIYTNLTGDYANEHSILAEDGFIDIICADLRGNRQDCIVKINNIVSGSNDKVIFNVYELSGTGINKTLTRTFSFPTVFTDGDGGKSIQPKFYYAGDFDGDGKMEILAVSAHHALGEKSPVSKIYIFDLLENRIKYEKEALNFTLDFVGTEQADMNAVERNSDKLFAMDCDGDGKTDLCLLNSTGVHSYTFEQASNGTMSLRHLMATDNPPDIVFREKRWLPCDHDGDGLSDLISPLEGNPSIWGYLNSKGNGKYGYFTFTHNYEATFPVKDSYIIADLNNDGFTDVAFVDKERSIFENIYVLISNGSSFSEEHKIKTYHKGMMIAPVNATSRTHHFPMISLKDSLISQYSFVRNETLELALTAMVSSYGVVHANQYEILSKKSANYVSGSGAVYPYVNFCEPMLILVGSSTSVDGTVVDSQTLKYENGILHKQGLGFCGFEKIETKNQKDQVAVDIYAPWNYCTLTSRTTPVSEIQYSYLVSHEAQGITKVLLDTKTENNLLDGSESTSQYKYDSYGYLTEELKNIKGYGTVKKSWSYQSYDVIGDLYFLGLPCYEGITITTAAGNYTKGITTDYEQMTPTSRVCYVNNEQTDYEEFVFDDFGNLLGYSTMPYSSSNILTTNYEYDSYGRVIKITNPLGLSEEEIYNTAGKRIKHKDIRGNITTYTYDVFGRQISELLPDGTNKTVAYSWATDNSGSVFNITSDCTGSPSSYIKYDALGRVVETANMSFDGTWLKVFREYDKNGNLSRCSLPTKKTNASYWNVYTYDNYDRLLTETEASGKITVNSYNGLNVTTISDGIETTRRYNSNGEIIQIEDPQGITEYSYRPDGQISSIITPDGEETSFDYDISCRRISVTDPNSDTVEWTYDDDGNIISEVIGGIYETSSEYDTFGRLTSMTIGDVSYSYTYDQYGAVSAVASDGATVRAVSYDAYGRITSLKEYASPQVWLMRDYSFSNGNVSTVKYTSDRGIIATEDFAYANGHISEIILDGATTIYKLVSENDLGVTSELKTGNFSRFYDYTVAGLPSRRTVKSGDVALQDYSYNFDVSTLNLKSREDLIRGKKEEFTYDKINRLKCWGDQNVNYDIMGNIISRSDVGTFGYKISSKPYALSEVELSASVIPLHRQEISYFTNGLPASISESNVTTSFTYGYDLQRTSMQVKRDGKEVLLRYYLGGCYERELSSGSNVDEKLYLCGDYYDAVALLEKSDSVDRLYYVFRDYLGSVRQICRSDGTLVQELDYDPWGGVSLSERTPDSSGSMAVPLFGRGFTGHEHLPWHGLINMNARFYDPVLGRFLSPDPLVQAPWDSQNFNRFTYALNNPLCYVDEDGEFIMTALLIGAAIGGIINVATHWSQIKAAGGGWSSFWKGASYFAIGGVAGAAGAAAGIAVATIGAGGIAAATSATCAAASMGVVPGALSGMAGGAANGLVLGYGNAILEGSSIGSAFAAGGMDALTGALTGGVAGGISGGIQAAASGRNLWTGKAPAVDITAHMNVSIRDLNLPTYNGRGSYSVYYGYDKTFGEVKYIGITSREPTIRFREHLNSNTERATLEYKVFEGTGNFSKIKARVMEQNKINDYGLNNLFNKRNEIAPKYWNRYDIKLPMARPVSNKLNRYNPFQILKH